MALPALPMGLTLWRLIALGALGYAAYQKGRNVTGVNDPLEDLAEGVSIAPTTPEKGVAFGMRFRRPLLRKMGVAHPSYHLDLAFFGRISLKKGSQT